VSRSLGISVAACLAALLLAGASDAQDAERPEILNVAFPEHLTAGQPVTARISFRAPRGNVVAVIQILEDLDGPRRVTSQRQVSVVASAFGFEEGDLILPIEFATPGRKRVVFSLVTDEREESDRERLYIEVAP
jgi:hypothetical protein